MDGPLGGISSIFLLVVNLEIDSITAKPYIPQKFVQNSLCCDMGMITFDLLMEAVRGQKC